MFVIVLIGLPAPFIAIHLLWVNLITDSLPAIALGMDPKDPNNMLETPRDPKESLFAKGGMKTTLVYGAALSLAVLIAYFSCAWLNGAVSYSEIKTLYDTNAELLHQAQTMAFTTLAFGELFHMIGMSNVNKSFVTVFKNKNWMMLVAFVAGIALQLFVIETPVVQEIFSTANLTPSEWGITLGFSVLPLIIHEIVVLFHFLQKKFKKAN